MRKSSKSDSKITREKAEAASAEAAPRTMATERAILVVDMVVPIY